MYDCVGVGGRLHYMGGSTLCNRGWAGERLYNKGQTGEALYNRGCRTENYITLGMEQQQIHDMVCISIALFILH